MGKLDKFTSRDLDILTQICEERKKQEQTDTQQARANPNQIKSFYDSDDATTPNALQGVIGGFILHCLTKGLVFLLFLFRGMFTTLFNGLVLNQMMVVFAVLDFWLTKNFTGKRLLGLRWYFDVDEHGTQKFFFECRANDKYLSFTFAKLFWIIQVVYTLAPFLFMILGFIRALFVLVNLELIIVSVGILFAGGLNLFFFFQANIAARLKQKQLKRKLTEEELQYIKFSTIVSYT